MKPSFHKQGSAEPWPHLAVLSGPSWQEFSDKIKANLSSYCFFAISISLFLSLRENSILVNPSINFPLHAALKKRLINRSIWHLPFQRLPLHPQIRWQLRRSNYIQLNSLLILLLLTFISILIIPRFFSFVSIIIRQ